MLLLHVVAEARSRYSHYLGEILRMEGFVDFAECDLSEVDASQLAQHDLVILPRAALSAGQMDLLVDYVTNGGKLIAFLPEYQFVQRLGLRPRYLGHDGGYLHINANHPRLRGLAADPVQILTPSVVWDLADVAQVTQLASVQPTAQAGDASSPAVVWAELGQGAAVLFAYDLPHTIARLRQGNADHVDLCFAGLDGIYRPSELFVGQLPVAQMFIPQADVQTALLARLVEELAPRPRIWYYPRAEQSSVLIMTSDDDWSTLAQFETLLAGLRKRQARCTFYVVPKTKLTPNHIDSWEAEGHTFSVHPALEADTVRGMKMQEPQSRLIIPMLTENIQRHQREFGRPVHTIRQHAVRWLGYVDTARVLAGLGVRMDMNYIAVSPYLGHLCGSGRPLRFVDEDGEVIDCFQQPTHWTEECLIHPEFVFSFKWTVEHALAETGEIIRQAAQRYYTPVALNSHPVSFATYSSPLIEGNWDAALAEGMPILSADAWLDWTEARDQIRIQIDADAITLHSAAAVDTVTILLPPDTAVAADSHVTVSRPQRWGRTYTAVTFTGLAAGSTETVRIG
ncbi:MAG: hypothetical protein KDD84_16635 [Caldilineaceae bacterium]|nr:hypothetical protein [Caldilineaceae bacterium]